MSTFKAYSNEHMVNIVGCILPFSISLIVAAPTPDSLDKASIVNFLDFRIALKLYVTTISTLSLPPFF